MYETINERREFLFVFRRKFSVRSCRLSKSTLVKVPRELCAAYSQQKLLSGQHRLVEKISLSTNTHLRNYWTFCLELESSREMEEYRRKNWSSS